MNPRDLIAMGLTEAQIQALNDRAARGRAAMERSKAQRAAAVDVAKLRREINDELTDACIAGEINVDANKTYRQRFRVDDDAEVVKLSRRHTREWINDVKHKAIFRGTGEPLVTPRNGPKSLCVGLVDPSGSIPTAAQAVTELTKQEMQDDPDAKDVEPRVRYRAMEKAYFRVLRKHPQLAKQYMSNHAAPYLGEDTSRDV